MSHEMVEFPPISPAVSVPASGAPIARDFHLDARPNPFRGSVQLSYVLKEASAVTVRVYDVRGRTVETLARRHIGVGTHRLEWAGRDSQGRSVPAGVYFVRLTAGSQAQGRKVIYMRRPRR